MYICKINLSLSFQMSKKIVACPFNYRFIFCSKRYALRHVRNT